VSRKTLRAGFNGLRSINDLDLDAEQKEQVLEWFAWKIWDAGEYAYGEDAYYGKSYDPLVIEGLTAHSYVMDLDSGGRHHPFTDLADLERQMVDSIKRSLSAFRESQFEKP
jgi:hypothetical protein